jgi:hypothetical protein
MACLHPKFWTTTERKLVEENYVSKGGRWCAEQLGRSPRAIRACARKSGIARKAEDYRHTSRAEIDAVIQRAYETGKIGAAQQAARAIGRSPDWVSHRASELGLSLRPDRAPWTEEEAQFVEANRHYSRQHIATLMRRRGWKRSPASIQQLINRQSLCGPSETHMSASALQACIGAYRGKIAKWIAEGRLTAERKPLSGNALADPYIISEVEVARFIVNNPGEVNLRKADGPWLIDLIARHGAAGLVEAKDKGSRIVAIKHAFPERTAAEIAAMVDSTPAAVSVTLSKAKARLQPVARSAA